MLLYAKQLLHVSLDTFNRLQNDNKIKCKLDLWTISKFSGTLHRELFGAEDVHSAEMPIQLSDMDFTMARIEAYKKACEKLKLTDKRSKNLLAEFGMTLQRNLFNGKE